jgi:hypothetical protein
MISKIALKSSSAFGKLASFVDFMKGEWDEERERFGLSCKLSS